MSWLKKRWEEASAQINPFDKGKTAATVRRSRPAAPPAQTRNAASRAFDQINPFDNNRTWKQSTPTQSKSTFQQAGQLAGQTARGMGGVFAKTANTGLAAGNVGLNLAKTGAASVFGSDQDYKNAVARMDRGNNRFIKQGSGVLGAGSWFKDTNEATNIGTKDLAGRIAGAGVETYLAGKGLKMGGFTGKALVDQGLKQGIKSQLPNVGKNAVVNTLEGVARGRNEGQNWKDSAKTGALSGVLGTVGDVGLGVAGAGLRKAVTSIPSAPKTAPPRVRARPDEVAALKGYLDNEYKLTPATPKEQALTVRDKQIAMQRLGIPQGRATELDNIRQYLDTTGTNKIPAYAAPKQPTSLLDKIKNSKLMQNEGGYVQIPGKKDPLDSLRQEALKYKSAEEFSRAIQDGKVEIPKGSPEAIAKLQKELGMDWDKAYQTPDGVVNMQKRVIDDLYNQANQPSLKDIKTRVIQTSDGKTEYVAQLGNKVVDRVGRETGFQATSTSPNFKTEGEMQKWISKNIALKESQPKGRNTIPDPEADKIYNLSKSMDNAQIEDTLRGLTGYENTPAYKAFKRLSDERKVNTDTSDLVVGSREWEAVQTKRIESEERIASEKAQKASQIRKDLDGFTDNKSAVQRGKIEKTLDAQIRYNGEVMSKRDYVRRLIQDGFIPDEKTNKIHDPSRKGSYQAVTKTEADYARHLYNQATQPTKGAAKGTMSNQPKGFILKETKPRGGKVDTVRVSKNPETGQLQRTIQTENAPFKALDQPEVTAKMEQYGKPEVPQSQPVRMPETKAEKKALVNEFMDLTNEYLGKERSGSISATQIAKKYNDQFGGLSDKQKLETILTLDGVKKSTDPEVLKAVQALSDQYDQSYNYFTKDRGINMGYRQDYSPRIYDVNGQKMNAQEYKLLQAGSGRQRGRKTDELYEDLLVSKDPAELLQKYQTSLEKAAAGKEYLSKLEKSGMIQTATDPSAARGLKPIVAEGMLADGTIYYAKPDIADKLNKLFGSQEASGFFEKAVEKAQGFNSFVQSFVLSGGVPNTPINAFGIMQVMKSGMAGHPIQGGKAFLTGLSKKNADKFFNTNSKYVKLMTEQGLDTRYNYSIKPSKGVDRVKTAYAEKGLPRGIGQAWDELTNDATFGRFMPALEVMHFKGVYDSLIAKNVDPKVAAKQAAGATSNFFGKNTLAKEATGSKIGRDAAGAFLFAPRFRESMLNFWGKNVKALNPKNMGKVEYRDNLKFMAASAATWAAMEGANKALTGEWMHDNPDGKKDKLLIPGGGLTGGKDIGIPFLPSIATVPRNVAAGAFNLATGNLKEAGKNAQSFLSIPARTGSELLTNEDYFGSQIVDEDASAPDRLGQMASHVVKNNLQPWIREGLNAAGQNLSDDTKKTLGIKKQTPFETASKSLEAPLRFYNPDYYRYGGVGLDKDQREMLRDMSGDQRKQFKEQSIQANKIDNQAEKEKKSAKYKGEEGIKKLANGEFYTKVGKTYRTFGSESEAKVAREKDNFKNSKDTERTIGGVKYKKNSSGNVVKAPTKKKSTKAPKKTSGRKSSGRKRAAKFDWSKGLFDGAGSTTSVSRSLRQILERATKG